MSADEPLLAGSELDALALVGPADARLEPLEVALDPLDLVSVSLCVGADRLGERLPLAVDGGSERSAGHTLVADAVRGPDDACTCGDPQCPKQRAALNSRTRISASPVGRQLPSTEAAPQP